MLVNRLLPGSAGVPPASAADAGGTPALRRNGFIVVHPRYRVPHRAEMLLAAVVCVLVLTVDLRGAIGFSSFAVLAYYLVANVAAFTQPADRRRWPRALQVGGAAGCVALAATLPWTSVTAGIGVLTVGALYRSLRPRTPE